MTKLKLTRALFLGAIVLGLFLAGCDTGLPSSGTDSQASNAGTGTVTLNVGLEGIPQPVAQGAAQSAALTVYPGFDGVEGFQYIADFKGSGGGVDLLGYEAQGGTQKIELATGTYAVTVTAYRGTGDDRVAIADRKLSGVKVQTNADTNAVFLLKPKTGGGLDDGTFSYSITVPETLETGGLYVGTTQVADLAGAADGLAEDDYSLTPGIYNVRLTLTRGTAPSVEYAGFSETLYIYSGLTSTLPEALSAFGDGDFSAQVELPVLDFVKPEARVSIAEAAIAPTAEYTGTIVWTENGAKPAGTAFKGEKDYVATVTLKANDGYTFTGIEENAVLFEESEDGVEVTTANSPGNGGTLTVTATFGATPPALVAESLFALPKLIDLPAVGKEVVKAAKIPANAEFTVNMDSLSWSEGDDLIQDGEKTKYNGAKVYKATVTLNANEGFTFAGLDADVFSYAGAEEVTNPEGEGTELAVTVVFPETAYSLAQTTAENLGLDLAAATGLFTVDVTDNATINGAAVPAAVTLNVTGGTLTLESGTVSVAGKLIVSGGTLAVSEGAKFNTGGAGVIDVKTLVNLQALAAPGASLTATVSDDVLVNASLDLPNNMAIKLAEGKTLTVTSTVKGGKSVETSGEGKVILSNSDPAANGANFEWAALKASTAAGKGLAIQVSTAATLGANSTVTVKKGTEVEVDDDIALTVPKTLNVAGELALTTTATLNAGTVVIGGGSNKVTLANATLTSTSGGAELDGTAGTVTLGAATDKLTLNDGGSLVVAGQGKVALINSEFGAGTYTAAGVLEIAAATAGDTITTGTAAGNGLVLGTGNGALKLLTSSTVAATYTLKAVSGGNVRIAGNSVTVGHSSDLTTANASNILASATGDIVLGSGGISLGSSAFLDFATGSKIGVFTGTGGSSISPSTSGDGTIGGAAVSEGSGVFTNTAGTLTVTAAKLTGDSDGNSRVAANATLTNT